MADELIIDLWFWGLGAPRAGTARWEALLNDAERARMNRFKFRHDQQSYLICRTRMRRVLARYLRADPRALAFGEVGRGKPCLAGPHAEAALAFNLSHTDGLACLGVSRSVPAIGVDLERIRPIEDDFAAYALTAPEVTAVRNAPPAARDRAFFHHWTAKEAFLKGPGVGLWQSLETFDVSPSMSPGAPDRIAPPAPLETRLTRIAEPVQRAEGWRLFTFDVGPAFIGAVAVRAGAGCSRNVVVRSHFLSKPSAPVRKPR